MKQLQLNSKTPLVLHPFLFALYPVVAMYSYNASQIGLASVVRPLVVVLAAAGVLMLLWWLILRNAHRAGLIVTLTVLLFFSYGHVLTWLTLDRHMAMGANVLAAIWSAVFILGTWAIARLIRWPLAPMTQIFNIIGSAALVLSSINGGVFLAESLLHPLTRLAGAGLAAPAAAASSAETDRPDIYYIILDGYASESTLRDIYHIDNPELYDYLKKSGFQIAENSHSNYMVTLHSLTSSLNFHYLDEMVKIDPKTVNDKPLEELLDQNQAAAFLKQRGYRFVMISGGFAATEVEKADTYIEAGGPSTISTFETSLLFSTVLAPWMDNISAPMHRQKNLDAFNQVVRQASQPGPKFVFAHILIPHPPFLFDSQGRPVENSTIAGRAGRVAGAGDIPAGEQTGDWQQIYGNGYREQVIYTSTLAKTMIGQLLANSKKPPVIIVQGDHGPDTYLDWFKLDKSCLRERFSILNALYLPEPGNQPIPQDLTPVNTFRMIFNRYFGADYPMEANHTYAFILPWQYGFTDVSNRLDQCPAFPTGK